MPIIDGVPLVDPHGDPRCGAASGGARKDGPALKKKTSAVASSVMSLLIDEAAAALNDPHHAQDQHPAVCGSLLAEARATDENTHSVGVSRLTAALSDWGESQTLTRAFESFFTKGGEAAGDSKRTLKLRQQLALQTWDAQAGAAVLRAAAGRLEAPMAQLGVAMRTCVVP
jgi:uncharacterized protein YgbK (DUF1537 family)